MKTTTTNAQSMWDNQMLHGLQNGNSNKAMVAIMAKYWNSLLHHCLRLTNDEALANDIAQATMVKVWENANAFNLNNDNSLFAWMRKVANNDFYDHARANLKLARIVTTAGEETILSTPAHACYLADCLCKSREIKKLIETAIASLTPICREVLELRYTEGLNNAEIVERLDITMKVFKGRMHRAVAALKVALKHA